MKLKKTLVKEGKDYRTKFGSFLFVNLYNIVNNP